MIDEAVAAACRGAARAAGVDPPSALFEGLPGCFVRSGADGLAEELDWSDPARSLGEFHERLLDAERAGATSRRKSSGSYYTPAVLVERVLDGALAPLLGEGARPRVCDTACGSGLFLVAAAERIARCCGASRAEAAALVHGVDVSAAAVAIARLSLWLWSEGKADAAGIAARVRVADALLDDALAQEKFDAVVGNPPFLNQLETATVATRARARALAGRYGAAAGGYADTSAVFLDLATRLIRTGGYTALVQPQSLLAARDAGPARASALSRAELVDLWAEPAEGKRLFQAGVRVCVPVMRARAGAEIEAKDGATTWAPRLRASRGLPEAAFSGGGTLADLATATADFRDQYYGLAPAVHERARPLRACPMLITTGLIDPAACHWGRRPARLLRAPRTHPCADLSLLDPAMRRWAAQRLVPKVLLATQTRVLEAWVDERGRALPVVPLISIVARDPADLWRIAAAVSSPLATLWAARNYAGAGLSADAIKLSARQTLEIPVPRRGPRWDAAAEHFRLASGCAEIAERTAHLRCAGESMLHAFRMSDEGQSALMAWWTARLAPRRREPTLP